MGKPARQYGTWPSAISPRALADTLRLNDVQWDGDTLIWLEGRGAQGVLVAQSSGQAARDLTGELSVRGRVGYGGGDFAASNGAVYFAANGRLYRQSLSGGGPRAITPAFGDAASPAISHDGKWLVYVHSYERIDGLALVDTEGQQWPRKFTFGTDFVMQPTWHPEGDYVAYIAWNHPQMPWDGTELRLAAVEYDRFGTPTPEDLEIVTGDSNTAIFQPEFSPDGRYLAYISDATGWNQLYLYDLAHQTHQQLTSAEADHGIAAWVQGLRTYAWAGDSHSLLYLVNRQGFNTLWQYDLKAQKSVRIGGLEHYTSLGQIAVSADNNIALIASSPKIPARVITHQLPIADIALLPAPDTLRETVEVIVSEPMREQIRRRSNGENVLTSQLADAQAMSWAGHDGETVYGLYYAPASDRFEGVGAPPLIVHVHGGPTSQVTANYAGVAQFFATRGYAVLMVNYRGSTGYGKPYMNKLRGSWGIYDVEDSASGAAYLAAQGLADPSKFVIMGGSAGGFTVLQSLVDKPRFYKAGICLYGVSDQFALVTDTHKFEERYSDSLLGSLPEAAAVYRARSPLLHADKIVDPVAVFQGEDDVVVPRSQSDRIVESLKARNVPHIYHVYPGEGHGWRKPETIEHYYNAVLGFLKQYVLYA
jgi:dipeptidyl aminopeptidase/acylaminoacyl peptidase